MINSRYSLFKLYDTVCSFSIFNPFAIVQNKISINAFKLSTCFFFLVINNGQEYHAHKSFVSKMLINSL